MRTGYGIGPVGARRSSGQMQAYAQARGSAWIAGWHPFAGDPARGGLIVVDTGQAGVPVLLNGRETGRTAFDGKIAVQVDVAGTPQRVEIGDHDLPLSTIAQSTRSLMTIRQGSGSAVRLSVASGAAGAIVWVRVGGQPPLLGTVIQQDGEQIPVGKKGRAWMPALPKRAVLSALLPDGRSCAFETGFDERGGPGRSIGPFECRDLR